MMKNGAGLELLVSKMTGTTQQARKNNALAEFADHLDQSIEKVVNVTRAIAAVMQGGEVNLALANATLYLDMFGHMVIAWKWLDQAIVAADCLEQNPQKADRDFYEGKLKACQYFFRYELCKLDPWSILLSKSDDTTISMQDAFF